MILSSEAIIARRSADEFTDPFSDHDACEVRVRSWGIRHDRGICDDESIDCMEATVLVDNALRIIGWSHFCSTAGMITGAGSLADDCR